MFYVSFYDGCIWIVNFFNKKTEKKNERKIYEKEKKKRRKTGHTNATSNNCFILSRTYDLYLKYIYCTYVIYLRETHTNIQDSSNS